MAEYRPSMALGRERHFRYSFRQNGGIADMRYLHRDSLMIQEMRQKESRQNPVT
jgi:hypothetical protein